jgi:hypothetical protein
VSLMRGADAARNRRTGHADEVDGGTGVVSSSFYLFIFS